MKTAIVKTAAKAKNLPVAQAAAANLSRIQAGLVKKSDVSVYETRHLIGGHSDTLRDIVFLPGGRQMVSCSEDHTARLWDVDSGVLLQTYAGHSDTVRSVAVRPDGRELATGSWDNTVRLWDVTSGKCRQVLTGHTDDVRSVIYSPDGRYLYSGGKDGAVKKWRAKDGTCLLTMTGHEKAARVVLLGRDGKRLYSGGEAGEIIEWSVKSGKELRRLLAHEKDVFALCFSKNSKQLYSGGADHLIRVWDLESGEPVKTFKGHQSWVMSLEISADGQELLSSGYHGEIKRWRLKSGRCLFTHAGPPPYVDKVQFSRNGKDIYLDCSRHAGRFSLKNGNCQKIFKYPESDVYAFGLNGDESLIAVCHVNGEVTIRRVRDNKLLKILSHPGTRDKTIYDAQFSPDSKRLATVSNNGYLTIWNWREDKIEQNIRFHNSYLCNAFFLPDGKRVITGGRGFGDCNLRLYDAETGDHIRSYLGHANSVFAVDLSSDGRYLCSASADHTVKLWAVESGDCLRTFEGHIDWVHASRFSRDGKFIVSGGYDGRVILWDVHTGQRICSFSGCRDHVYTADISPDNALVAAGGIDRGVRIWSVKTGRTVTVLGGSDKLVNRAVFTRDGQSILSTGYYALTRWPKNSSCFVRQYPEGSDAVWSLAVNAQQNTLLVGGESAGVKKIDLSRCIETNKYNLDGSTAHSLQESPDGSDILVGKSNVIIMDRETGIVSRWLVHQKGVDAALYSRLGGDVFTGSRDGKIRRWCPEQTKILRAVSAHEGKVLCLVLTRANDRMISAGEDGRIRLWDTGSGSLKAAGGFDGHTDRVSCLVLGFGGQLLYSAGWDSTIRVWNLSTGACVRKIDAGEGINRLLLSDDGPEIIAGTNSGRIKIIDPDQEKIVREMHRPGAVNKIRGLGLSHGGAVLAAGSFDGTVDFWDLKTGMLRVTFHNVRDGFLWSAPPDETAPCGWFWTDCPERVHIIQQDQNGENLKPVTDPEERQRYVSLYNDQNMIINRLNHFEQYLADVQQKNREPDEPYLLERLQLAAGNMA